MKKFHFILVTFICLLCSIEFSHTASASEVTIHGFHITYEDDVLTCSGQGKLESSVISSLPKYEEYKNSTKKIIIEDGITGIGNDTFENFVKVESVQFPDVMNSIGFNSFQNCKSLTSIVLPDELKELGGYAFAHCDNLSTVTFGQYHSPINYYDLYFRECAFAYTPLSTAIVPEYTLAGDAYPIKCDGLALYKSNGKTLWKYLSGNTSTDYIMPDIVTNIAEKAFAEAKYLEKITLSNNLVTIGSACFHYCTQLKSLTIPASVKNIPNRVFYLCYSLETITNNSDCIIDLSSWHSCHSDLGCNYTEHSIFRGKYTEHEMYKDTETNTLTLTLEPDHTIKKYKFWIPGSTTKDANNYYIIDGVKYSVSVSPFHDFDSICAFLSKEKPVGTLQPVQIVDKDYILHTKVIYEDYLYNIDLYGIEDLTPPAGGIAPTAVPTNTSNNEGYDVFTFSYDNSVLTCSGKGTLTQNDIPATLPWEEYKKNTKKIVISDGITEIGDEIFKNFASVESIEFPQKMDSIGSMAFTNCTAIKSISLPDNLSYISEYAFYGCDSLEKIEFGQCLSALRLGRGTFLDTNLKEVILPETTLEGNPYPILFDGNAIYEYSVFGVKLCHYLNSCTDTSYAVREGTTHIEGHAFSDNSSLETITLPPSLTTLSDYCFFQCTNLKEITLPETITHITTADDYATLFPGCTNLETINNYTNYEINLLSIRSTDIKYAIQYYADSGDTTTYYAYRDEATKEIITTLKPNHTAKQIKFQPPSLDTVGNYYTINNVKYQLIKRKPFNLEDINAIFKYVDNSSTVGMLQPVELLSADCMLTDRIKYNGYLYDVDLSDINNLEFGKTPAPTNAPTVVPTQKPTATPIVLPVVNLKVTQIKNRQIQLRWNTPKYKFIEIWRKEKHENKYTLLTRLYNSTFYIDHLDPLRKSNATYQYIVLMKTQVLDFELIDFSKFKSTNITTNWLMQPSFVLKRNKKKKYISVKLQNYEGYYIVIEAKKNPKGKFVKIPLTKYKISKKNQTFTLRYKKHNKIMIRIKTYVTINKKKKYSPYSMEKTIRV